MMRYSLMTEVMDHGLIPWYDSIMEEIQISKFKVTCLAVLDRVCRTGQPVLITRFGKPVAEIIPPTKAPSDAWLGAMRRQGAIIGDLVEPAATPGDWEVLADIPGKTTP